MLLFLFHLKNLAPAHPTVPTPSLWLDAPIPEGANTTPHTLEKVGKLRVTEEEPEASPWETFLGS